MEFSDKKTPTGEPERYPDGAPTERFVIKAETKQESRAIQAALTQTALSALESALGSQEEAKLLLDYLMLETYHQERTTVNRHQAEVLSRLIRRGAYSADGDVLKNQFMPKILPLSTNESDTRDISEVALDVAEEIANEATARKFTSSLDGISPEDFK